MDLNVLLNGNSTKFKQSLRRAQISSDHSIIEPIILANDRIPSVNTLILETTSEKCLIALAQGKELIASLPLLGGSFLSKNIASSVDKLLKSHSFTPERIGVGIGPGSYTGVRVGAALAKALSFGYAIPILGFSSLIAFTPKTEKPFAILVDAKGGGLYLQLGEKTEGFWEYAPAERLSLEKALERLKSVELLASPHPQELEKKLPFDLPWVETAPDPLLLADLIEREYTEKGAPSYELGSINYLSLI